MAYPDCPAWGKEDVKYIIEEQTLPPGEEKKGFSERLLFIETLTLAIALKKDGELLLKELQKKWPSEVESSMTEAETLASQQVE